MRFADIPDSALMPMAWVREHFVEKVNAANRDMTTVELAAEFGHSPEWWQDRARSGQIRGAYQAGKGRSKWYVPREGATVFLDAYKEARRRKQTKREPWKGAGSASARPRRSQAIPEGQMVGGGPSTVGRSEADAA